MKFRLPLVSILLLFLLPTYVDAQKEPSTQTALNFITQFHQKWDLAAEDVNDLKVTDQYTSKHNGVTHIYFQQQYKEIGIHNAIWGVHLLPNGKVAHNAVAFHSNISKKIRSATPLITATEALRAVTQHLGVSIQKSISISTQPEKHLYFFNKHEFAEQDIRVELNYFGDKDNQLKLCWHVEIAPKGSVDTWAMQVDARSGAIVNQENQTISCNFDNMGSAFLGKCLDPSHHHQPPSLTRLSRIKSNGEARYNVFPAPLESPLLGEREILTDPFDPVASPFGWHDNNGEAGADYFLTRGNNVFAYRDRDADNAADSDTLFVEDLNFDFEFDPTREPIFNREAALVQLFYMNNFMHDFTYRYGFDEAAGNFQELNYNGEGRESDAVNAEAMDGSGENNANFSSGRDGNPGRMQMFLWNRRNLQLLQVNAPETISGFFRAGAAGFGPAITTDTAYTGQVVQIFDGSTRPNLGCETIINPEEVEGKIALVYRGQCPFEQKVQNAQDAGATAVIIVNYNSSLITPGNSPSIEDPSIPTIGVNNSTGELIRSFIDEGVEVTIQAPIVSPTRIDASFDNGVIAHEYGHGISTRLTGGPSISSCLPNSILTEQMGEGWSDFFTLVTTTTESDIINRTKSIGNYVNGGDANSGGIRRVSYSPSELINDQTYNDVIQSPGVHQVGEIWASTLWDLYWGLVDEYGWDADLINGTGGNNIAVQLVMDGMKLQSCEPGFIDGRDAILAADRLNYGGDNQCLIWSVFARRGLGLDAVQGSSVNVKDGKEGFEQPPACIETLKIEKSVTPLIRAGEQIEIILTVRNDKLTPLTGVTVEDELPMNSQIITQSIQGAEMISANGNTVTFDIGELNTGEEMQISFRVETDPSLGSAQIFEDDFDVPGFDWRARGIEGRNFWKRVTDTLRNMEVSWAAASNVESSEQILELGRNVFISGEQPVVRFRHKYSTEPIADGGIVEVSNDRGSTWTPIPTQNFLRNSYNGELAFGTAFIFEQDGFWGLDDTLIESYADLSAYLGQEVRVRFHFYTDNEPEENGFEEGNGWTIDYFEVMDLFSYNTQVCVNSDQGDVACEVAEQGGTFVESSQQVSSTEDLSPEVGLYLDVFPNPTSSTLNVQLESISQDGQIQLSLHTMDGRLVRSALTDLIIGEQKVVPVNVSDMPAGIYILKIQTTNGLLSKRIVKE